MDIRKMFDPTSDHLCCPICGFEYVHIEKASIDQNKLETHVSKEACVNIERKGDNGHRGSQIRIGFWCEDGHRFELSMMFRKGFTYVELERGTDHTGGEIKELWRD